MFDFEKLKVYHKAEYFNKSLRAQIVTASLDYEVNRQLKRSALSISLNIAEGSGRFTNLDKRRFYVMARGSVFETVAILRLMVVEKLINHKQFDEFYTLADELSRMLYVMIKKLES